MTRQEILKAAEDCVCRDRNATHGEPENRFGKLAAVWSALLGIKIRDDQAANMLNVLKSVRAWDNPGHDDNWVDGAGYMACGGELAAAVKDSLTAERPSKEPESKPKFAVGQVWETSDLRYAEIANTEASSLAYPIVAECGPFRYSYTIDGRFRNDGANDPRDLVRLISDQEDAA